MVQLKPGEILIKAKYLKAEVSEPLISYVTKKFNVVFNILFSDVEIIEGCPIGGTVGILSGNHEGIDDTIEYFKSKEINVEVIKDAGVS